MTGSDDGLLTPEVVEMTLLDSRSRTERVTMAIPRPQVRRREAACGRARPVAWLAPPFEGLDEVEAPTER